MARVTPESIEIRVMDGADARELLEASTDALVGLKDAAFLYATMGLPTAYKQRKRVDRLEAALRAFAKDGGE